MAERKKYWLATGALLGGLLAGCGDVNSTPTPENINTPTPLVEPATVPIPTHKVIYLAPTFTPEPTATRIIDQIIKVVDRSPMQIKNSEDFYYDQKFNERLNAEITLGCKGNGGFVLETGGHLQAEVRDSAGLYHPFVPTDYKALEFNYDRSLPAGRRWNLSYYQAKEIPDPYGSKRSDLRTMFSLPLYFPRIADEENARFKLKIEGQNITYSYGNKTETEKLSNPFAESGQLMAFDFYAGSGSECKINKFNLSFPPQR